MQLRTVLLRKLGEQVQQQLFHLSVFFIMKALITKSTTTKSEKFATHFMKDLQESSGAEQRIHSVGQYPSKRTDIYNVRNLKKDNKKAI